MKVVFDFKPVYDQLSQLELQQLPYAHTLALNNTAEYARRAELQEFRRQFDRPKPSTLNEKAGPLRIKYAKRGLYPNDFAEVRVKDTPQVKGEPALVYLSHNIHGGRRAEKRSESLLRRAGILFPGYYTVPADGARFDQYGNMSAGQMQEILSAVGAQRDALSNFKGRTLKDAYRKQRRMRSAAAKYFVAYRSRQQTRHLAEGIWQRFGNSDWEVRPVLLFVKGAPRYKKRIRWEETAMGVARMRFPIEFHQAMKYALATAKVKPNTLLGGFASEVTKSFSPLTRGLERLRTG